LEACYWLAWLVSLTEFVRHMRNPVKIAKRRRPVVFDSRQNAHVEMRMLE
jgi:hypothetical protein